MKKVLAVAAVVVFAGGSAFAGGIDRSGQGINILFEDGRAVNLSYSFAIPKVSGTVGGGTVASGNVTNSYGLVGLGFKQPLTEDLDFALIYDTPFGADTTYPTGPYPMAGTTAKLVTNGVSGILRYKFDNGTSIYGGLKAQSISGVVSIPLLGYSLKTDTPTDFGYLVGAAYERPDIALRVALTYSSKVKHDLKSVEGGVPGNFTTTTPQSLNLSFQTGIAADTLLFGSLRWVDWSEYDIIPPNYPANPLVAYSSDTITYSLGIGRKLTENWSAAISLGYEGTSPGTTSNLGPNNGYVSLGLGATYTRDKMKISGGIRYLDLNDATTHPPIGGSFTDNSAIALGVQITYSL